MNDITNYNNLMSKATEIALATSINEVPNVRIVNYIWDDANPNTIYIFTDPESVKMKEVKENNNLAFTTIGNQVVQVQHGVLRQSSRNVDELKSMFLKKMPFYADVFEHVPVPVFQEIKFQIARVIMDMGEPQIIKF
ncbi:MAG: pyridoxamine 5'-phosphate oxidase family protein [Rickettsiales bacterium]|jgi:uncharacterized pyridoxamine 5'-phosphate oxidase family protein|nr:pyridoxamine 5'-phosphate oxidase family protein [Rickettsiales bacterium]